MRTATAEDILARSPDDESRSKQSIRRSTLSRARLPREDTNEREHRIRHERREPRCSALSHQPPVERRPSVWPLAMSARGQPAHTDQPCRTPECSTYAVGRAF